MGEEPEFDLENKDCALIHTGGMLPEGADAVVMLEDTQVLDAGEIEIFRAVAPGENVIEIGEDVPAGWDCDHQGNQAQTCRDRGVDGPWNNHYQSSYPSQGGDNFQR